MDQGVIETTKRLYKKKLIMFLLEQQLANPLVNFLDLLKNVTIKTILYLVAKAWEEIKPETLQKSWEKMWPNIPPENYGQDETTSNEDIDFIQVFKELKGCVDVEENDISEWINSDTDVSHQVLSEDDIVNTCIENTKIDSSENEDNGIDQSTGTIHGEASAMLEQLMTYFEKQSETSSAVLLTLRRLSHRTVKLLYSSLIQKNITDFLNVTMVLLWTTGDAFKTCYFVSRKAPLQFWMCGTLQVIIDITILSQVVWYRNDLISKNPRID
ncbi:jerky protein homolog-like isoform X1 [Daktulosphaira vitifoliae]|uniref:jerky protein homolog-like isoform X1 n=1 Tax=Daktulosphaira vitifoliae TaxID=58002 RepID=UPI0021AAE3D8|nr:jerky protein homolog-like isoform X1 [Daktulosphaira vitifoliae]